MNLMLFSVICLIIANKSVFAEEVIECNEETKDKLDTFMLQLGIVGDPNGKFPTNQNEFDVMCKTNKEKTKWSIAYNDKCLTGTAQQMMSLSLRDLEKVFNKYCDSLRLNKLFISWSGCGNSAHNQTVKCWRQYVLDLERTNMERDRIPNEDKMPLICCFFHTYDHCIEEALVNRGDNICPQQAVDGIHSILDDAAGQAIHIHCGDYAIDSDKCEGIYRKYNHLKDIKIEKLKNKSPANPSIEILLSSDITLKSPDN